MAAFLGATQRLKTQAAAATAATAGGAGAAGGGRGGKECAAAGGGAQGAGAVDVPTVAGGGKAAGAVAGTSASGLPPDPRTLQVNVDYGTSGIIDMCGLQLMSIIGPSGLGTYWSCSCFILHTFILSHCTSPVSGWLLQHALCHRCLSEARGRRSDGAA